MQALGIATAHIVGLSQGGAIALQLALENPELVDKLVLVDSAALGAQPSCRVNTSVASAIMPSKSFSGMILPTK